MNLVISVLDCGFLEDLFHNLSRYRVVSDQPAVSQILLFAFLEDRHEVYKQSSGTSFDSHDLSNLIESSLAMTLMSFITTLRYILSGPMCFFSVISSNDC